MNQFQYEIFINGEKKNGMIASANVVEATSALRSQGALVIKVIPAKKAGLFSKAKAKKGKNEITLNYRFPRLEKFRRKCISQQQVEQMLLQLSAMAEAGVPLLHVLGVLARQHPGPLARSLDAISIHIRNGQSLADGFAKEAPYMSKTSLGLLRAGETNGQISGMCKYASQLMEHAREVRNMLIEASIYPSLVFCIACGVAYFLVTGVIPKVLDFVKNHSADIPWITQLLVNITDAVKQYGTLALSAYIATMGIIFLMRFSKKIVLLMDRLFLQIPVIGGILLASANSMWCRTLGTLLGSGITITHALELTESVIWNQFIKTKIRTIRQSVSQGHGIAESFRLSGLGDLSPMAYAMTDVGENAGTIDDGLLYAADFSENELKRKVRILSKLIEPAMFVIVGGMVAFVYIAFFMGVMAASRSILRHS